MDQNVPQTQEGFRQQKNALRQQAKHGLHVPHLKDERELERWKRPSDYFDENRPEGTSHDSQTLWIQPRDTAVILTADKVKNAFYNGMPQAWKTLYGAAGKSSQSDSSFTSIILACMQVIVRESQTKV